MTIDKPLPEQIPALRRLWQQAFRDDDTFLDGFFRTGFSFDRCRCITIDHTPVAALYWFDCSWQEKKLAYLYAVATDEAFRGQGLCRKLLTDTHTHLLSLGYSGAVLVPGGEELFRLYEKFGYHPFCPMEQQTFTAGDQPYALQVISPENYATQRKKRLPPDSVLQEGVTLTFLQTFARFYAGDDCLFCAAEEGDTLYFQEFLGDTAAIPGILAASQTKKGVLRQPGGSNPFAMYRSFDGSNDQPNYFGLALN